MILIKKSIIFILILSMILVSSCHKEADELKGSLHKVPFYSDNNQYGYINSIGKTVIPIEYKWARYCSFDYFIDKQDYFTSYGFNAGYNNNEVAVFNIDGEKVFTLQGNWTGQKDEFGDKPHSYLICNPVLALLSKQLVYIRNNSSADVYNFVTGTKIFSCENVIMNLKDAFLIKRDGKYLRVDRQGEVQNIYIMDDISFVSNEKYIVAELNEKWGVYGHNGEVILPFIFDSIECVFANGNIYGKISKTNAVYAKCGDVLSDQLIACISYYNSKFCVAKLENGKEVVISSEGKKLSKLYDRIFIFDGEGESYEVVVFDSGKCYHLNSKFEILYDKVFKKCLPFVNEIAMVKIESGYVFIDRNGNFVSPVFAKIVGMSEGFGIITDHDNDIYIIGENWQKIAQIGTVSSIRHYEHFIDGLAWIEFEDDSVGYVNTSGKIIWKRKLDK